MCRGDSVDLYLMRACGNACVCLSVCSSVCVGGVCGGLEGGGVGEVKDSERCDE